MIKFKSKKGDLPITLLVIGIFALLAFALLTFFIADFKTSNSFVSVDVMQSINSMADEYLFYKNHEMDEATLDSIFGGNITEDFGRRYFFSNISIDEGIPFINQKKVLLFSIKYQVPS
ncbi:MAG: hypothetical protein KKB62_02850 [Nanoarchaeota archaeon]|nr:hypothetical protein [Nanoarchaeota archaeon]